MPLWEDVLHAAKYQDWDNETPKLQEISKNHPIYSSIANTIPFPIKQIFKTQSPELYAKFLLKKEQYHNPKVIQLFHDTEVSNIPSIIKTNLDWRRVVRSKYGKGVSFAKTAAYAYRYSNGFNTNKAMIIADVLVENVETYTGNFPCDFIDTTKSSDENVFVKYCDDEFFPKYVVYYTGSKKKGGNYTYNNYNDDDDDYGHESPEF